jgi:hypothetical protein
MEVQKESLIALSMEIRENTILLAKTIVRLDKVAVGGQVISLY